MQLYSLSTDCRSFVITDWITSFAVRTPETAEKGEPGCYNNRFIGRCTYLSTFWFNLKVSRVVVIATTLSSFGYKHGWNRVSLSLVTRSDRRSAKKVSGEINHQLWCYVSSHVNEGFRRHVNVTRLAFAGYYGETKSIHTTKIFTENVHLVNKLVIQYLPQRSSENFNLQTMADVVELANSDGDSAQVHLHGKWTMVDCDCEQYFAAAIFQFSKLYLQASMFW